METSTLELYNRKKGEAFNGEVGDGLATIQSADSVASTIMREHKTYRDSLFMQK